MDLNELLVFARVVQAGSFTDAAAKLGMPKSTVSRKVSDLEDRLGARLLQRTTRKLSLTDAGRAYFDYCARIVSEAEDAERAVSNLQETPRGLLRVTAGMNAAYLGPIVSDFLARYPEVELELYCTGRLVDLVAEGFDVGIRAGTLTDSSLVARPLGQTSWLLVAAPAYLEKRGRPQSPEELKGHECLLFGIGSMRPTLHFERDGSSVQVEVPARLLVSDFDVLRAATLAGLGIGLLPSFNSSKEIQSGALVSLLSGWKVPSTPIQIVYPSARYLSPKVRRFIEHVQQYATPPPWE